MGTSIQSMRRKIPNFRYSIRRAASRSDVAALRSLLKEYADSLPEGKCDDEPVSMSIRTYLREPNAAWIARSAERGIGCVALRGLDKATARLERLFVRDEYRGLGVGRSLCRTAVRFARRRAYSRVVLATLPSMLEAQALYESFGFVVTDAPDWEGCESDGRICMVLEFVD